MNKRNRQDAQDSTKSDDSGNHSGSIKRRHPEPPVSPQLPHKMSLYAWEKAKRKAEERKAVWEERRAPWEKAERKAAERKAAEQKAAEQKAAQVAERKAAERKAAEQKAEQKTARAAERRAAQEAWEARKKTEREKAAREKVAREAWEAEKTKRENMKQENAEREKAMWEAQNTEWKAQQKAKLRSGSLKEKWIENANKLEQERKQQQEQQRRQERELRKELEDMKSDKLLYRLILVIEQALGRHLEHSIKNDLEELEPKQMIALVIRGQMLQQQKLPMKHLIELLNGALRVQNERRRAEGSQ